MEKTNYTFKDLTTYATLYNIKVSKLPMNFLPRILPEIPQTIHQEIPQEIHQEIPQETPQEIPQEIQQTIQQTIPKEFTLYNCALSALLLIISLILFQQLLIQ